MKTHNVNCEQNMMYRFETKCGWTQPPYYVLMNMKKSKYAAHKTNCF